MIIQHNLAAMNANRTLGITKGKQAKSSEKLTSGYKINRAADDAAGLSISEKMRKQINALDRASTNAEDGISAVQTAEGALSEVHSMLHRMNELSVQAANGTLSESDRESIQAEIEELTTEIDRVAETTKFNETYLLKGNTAGTETTKTVAAHDAGIAGKLEENADGTFTFTLSDTDLDDGDKIIVAGKEYVMGETPITIEDGSDIVNVEEMNFAVDDEIIVDKGNGKERITIVDTLNKDIVSAFEWNEGDTVDISGVTYTVLADGETWKNTTTSNTDNTLYSTSQIIAKVNDSGVAATTIEVTNKAAGIDTSAVQLTSTTVPSTQVSKYDTVEMKDLKEALSGNEFIYNDELKVGTDGTINEKIMFEKIAKELEIASSIGTDTPATVEDNGDGSFKITLGTVQVKNQLSFSLHAGADADMANKVMVDIETMSAANLGIKGLDVVDLSGMKATYATDAITDAIAKVSKQRSQLGAIQNRLEAAISNLDNVSENTSAAESRIRDTDMAEEMVEYSKNMILSQAGQSMLAQANQSTQGVLQLLQ